MSESQNSVVVPVGAPNVDPMALEQHVFDAIQQINGDNRERPVSNKDLRRVIASRGLQGLRKSQLNPILAKLVKDGKLARADGKPEYCLV